MYTSLLFLLTECRSKKMGFFVLIFLLNIIAAILEGSSYYFMIAAFTVLSENASFLFLSFLESKSFAFILILGLFSQLLKSIFCIAAGYLNAHLAMHLQHKLQMKIQEQIFRLSFCSINQYKKGELLSYAQSPNYFVRQFLEKLNHFLVSFFLSIVAVGLMFLLSFSLTVLTIIVFSLALVSQKALFKKNQKISSHMAQEMELSNGMILQNLFNIKLIHLFNLQSHLKPKIENAFRKIAHFSKKILIFSSFTSSLNEMVGSIVVTICFLTGYWIFSLQHEQPLPLLLGFITIAYRLSGKILGAMNNLSDISALKGPLDQIKKILDSDGKKFLAEQGKLEAHFKKEIRFHNVSFRYGERERYAVSNFSCSIAQGTTVALVGHSGAGKSTVLDLLSCLYQPNFGLILVDGIPLSDLDLFSWRNKIAYVNQEIALFDGTIEDNIRLEKTVSLDQMIEAAKIAEAHAFISKLPAGYQTSLQEHQLSSGEKQRIALARALVRNSEIFILDEATSHLDMRCEALIQNSLKHLKKTWIIATHRLSPILHADMILVMDQGRIVEQGTHEELLQKEGFYAKLWNLQNKAKALV